MSFESEFAAKVLAVKKGNQDAFRRTSNRTFKSDREAGLPITTFLTSEEPLMGIMDIIRQYASDNGTGATPDSSPAHFDEVARGSSASELGRGVSEAMRSDRTPAFGDMVSQMFGQSNPQQRAGVLNQILGSLGPGALASLPGSLGGLLGHSGVGGATTSTPQLTPEQASQVSADDARTLAAHAEQHDPNVIDRVGDFYGQHPDLVKGLGAMALAVVMGKMANR